MSSNSDESYEVEVEIIAETDLAILCSTSTGEHWIPKSILAGEVESAGYIGPLTIPAWFVEREELV